MVMNPGIPSRCPALSPFRSGVSRRALLLFLLLVHSFPRAEDVDPSRDAFLLPEILVTTSSLRLAPNSSLTASVLDRDRLTRHHHRTLADALTESPGVDTASLGAVGSAQLVSLRGASTEQVLVLLDGHRLNPLQGGGADLSLVPLETLERVEVIRGCAPSRYGSEGLGGVVNLVSRGRQEGGRFDAATGSGGSGRLAGRYRSRLDRDGTWHLRLTGSQGVGAPSFSYADPERGTVRERSNVDSFVRMGGLSLSHSPARGVRFPDLSVDLDRMISRRGAPGPSEFPSPEARLEETGGGGRFQASLRGDEEGVSPLALSMSFTRRDVHYRDPAALPRAVEDSHVGDRLEFAADSGAVLGDRFILHAGAGASNEKLESTTDGLRRDSKFFLSLEPRLLVGRHPGVSPNSDFAARLSLEGGVRVETSRLFPTRATPRAGILLTLHPPTRMALRANAGLAVRNPSFDDLFFSAAAFARGNPDLRPERSRLVDAGLLWSPGPLGLSVTAFRHDARDLIQWSPDFSGRWRPLNVSRAVVNGLEGEGSLSLPLSFGLLGVLDSSFTWMQARDRSGDRNLDGKLLPRRPPFKSGAGLRLSWRQRVGMHVRSRFVSYRWLDAPNVSYLPGYLTYQAGFSIEPAKDLVFAFTIHNLTDVQARDLNEYPLPGRQWELRTSVGF